MSDLAVRAWAWGRFLFVFLLLFSLCQMGRLERREQEEGANSASQTLTKAMDWETWSLSVFGVFWGNPLCKRRCCVHSTDARHFARMVKWVLGDVNWTSAWEQMVHKFVGSLNWTESERKRDLKATICHRTSSTCVSSCYKKLNTWTLFKTSWRKGGVE